jgi:5-oxoprolinase (ATP-hydrolysing) subunit A
MGTSPRFPRGRGSRRYPMRPGTRTAAYDVAMAASIDLNADVGESLGAWPMGADAALIPHVSSVNVACGFHAGDPAGIRATIRLALAAGASVGAHPGYPDLVGFGRRAMAMTPDDIEASVLYQVAAVAGIAHAEGGSLRHVKPHGALYHRVAADHAAALAFATAVARLDGSLAVVGAPGSALLRAAADLGLATLGEGFADRVYEPDGRLRSRDLPGALHEDPAAAAAQAVSIARDGVVTAGDGSRLRIDVATICIHGDTRGAPAIAAAVWQALDAAGIPVRSPGPW